MPNPWPRRVASTWKNWIRPLVVIIVVVTAFKSAVADWNDVPTGSMEPTILSGDRIIVNKLAYDLKVPYTTWHLAQWSNPKRGDIVICYSPSDGKRLVKRVVGIPGDTVSMRHHRLYVNGQGATYDAVSESTPEDPRSWFVENLVGHEHLVTIGEADRSGPHSFGSLTVPQDHYLVLGDNRLRSADSRVFGFVPRKDIVGRAVAVAISLDRHQRYRPRWERTGRVLH